jgi:xylan 1,4-beta-xylosidase
MNKLGDTELQNKDTSSWAAKNKNGNVQLLFWDFTNTHPGEKVWNQTYYVQDLPSKEKGKVKIEVDGLQKGKYVVEIYKVGYKVNDAYADYLALNKPSQLTIQQVNTIKTKNNGSPIITEKITVDAKGTFNREFKINENDVILVNLIRQ